MKILKKGGRVVEKRGEEETKSMPHAVVKFCVKNKQTNKYFIVNQDAPKNRKIIINLLQ
jgi:hypothetical protein